MNQWSSDSRLDITSHVKVCLLGVFIYLAQLGRSAKILESHPEAILLRKNRVVVLIPLRYPLIKFYKEGVDHELRL